MSERTPAISSLNRISIGWVNVKPIPGTRASNASDMAATSMSFERPAVHSSFGFRMAKTSDSSMPMRSVAISGEPIRVTTWSTS